MLRHAAPPTVRVRAHPTRYWRPTKRTLSVDGATTPYHDAVFWSGVATVAYLPSTAFPAGLGAESGLPVGLQARREPSSV